MNSNKEVTLPSGAKLEITLAPFEAAKTLFQAVLEEMRGLKLDPNADIDVNLYKDLFCTGFASKKVEAALAECLKRATYNGVKISKDTFEPVEAREDYMQVMLEVAMENLKPFTKNLLQQFQAIMVDMKGVQS